MLLYVATYCGYAALKCMYEIRRLTVPRVGRNTRSGIAQQHNSGIPTSGFLVQPPPRGNFGVNTSDLKNENLLFVLAHTELSRGSGIATGYGLDN
jgi:hypothetical protein